MRHHAQQSTGSDPILLAMITAATPVRPTLSTGNSSAHGSQAHSAIAQVSDSHQSPDSLDLASMPTSPVHSLYEVSIAHSPITVKFSSGRRMYQQTFLSQSSHASPHAELAQAISSHGQRAFYIVHGDHHTRSLVIGPPCLSPRIVPNFCRPPYLRTEYVMVSLGRRETYQCSDDAKLCCTAIS